MPISDWIAALAVANVDDQECIKKTHHCSNNKKCRSCSSLERNGKKGLDHEPIRAFFWSGFAGTASAAQHRFVPHSSVSQLRAPALTAG
jgi:hypothetical protein